MIVYGSRMYGRKQVVKGWGYCDNCGYRKHTSYDGRKWGHLYFIPLIPRGPHVRVLKECTKCSHGAHVPVTGVPGMLNEMRQNVERALTALEGGQSEFNSESEDRATVQSCAACVAGAVELLCCLGAEAYVDEVLTRLERMDRPLEHRLMQGAVMEFRGDQNGALGAYAQAAELDPEEALAWTLPGAIHFHTGNLAEAQNCYEQAASLSPDPFGILQALLVIYKSAKDHAKLAETYVECFKLVPELTQDKKAFKAYKAACKKAGVPPQF